MRPDVTRRGPRQPIGDVVDPAEQYLPAITEIYRRTLRDGQDFVVRVSAGSSADVFGMTWSAPTGSTDECLGDLAVSSGCLARSGRGGRRGSRGSGPTIQSSGQLLPTAGRQPADPASAEAQIRERYALLVGRSIAADDKPTDLLDDYTGVQAAIAAVDLGQYRDVAASAAYSIDELVFTQPDEAWFRYTIVTNTSTFANRFGTATFNGSVWQITRATICQDRGLAAAPCRPEPEPVVLPTNPEWEAAWQEWMTRASLYPSDDGCPPLTQC